MQDEKEKGGALINLLLKAGFRVYFSFTHLCVRSPRKPVSLKIGLANTSDIFVVGSFFASIPAEYKAEVTGLIKDLSSIKTAQNWPGGYLICRKFFQYGSVSEYEDESGIIDSKDLEGTRLYPKSEAVRIVFQYRAYKSYTAIPSDPMLGLGMTDDEKYQYMVNISG